MEPSWNNTSVLLGNDVQIFPELLRARENSAEECMGLLKDFRNMQQTKLRRSKDLRKGEDQNLGSQLAFDDTHCPDTRKRLPREWLIRR